MKMMSQSLIFFARVFSLLILRMVISHQKKEIPSTGIWDLFEGKGQLQMTCQVDKSKVKPSNKANIPRQRIGGSGPKTRKECQLCSNLLLVSPVRLQYIITLQVFLAWESIIWKIFRSSKCSSDLQTQKMSQSSVWCFYWYTRFSNYTPENYKLGAKKQIENHLPNKPPWLWIPAVHFPGCIRACWWLLNFNTADWESWPYCASLWFSAASSVTLSAKDGGKHRQLAQVVSYHLNNTFWILQHCPSNKMVRSESKKSSFWTPTCSKSHNLCSSSHLATNIEVFKYGQ